VRDAAWEGMMREMASAAFCDSFSQSNGALGKSLFGFDGGVSFRGVDEPGELPVALFLSLPSLVAIARNVDVEP
jgi:hypothetical protein